jgi:hypothetical protein
MNNDPYMVRVMKREEEKHTFGAKLGNALLLIMIPFFTFEVSRVAFEWVASGKNPKVDTVLDWPISIFAGLIIASILIGATIEFGAKNRERLALVLTVLAMAIELIRNT